MSEYERNLLVRDYGRLKRFLDVNKKNFSDEELTEIMKTYPDSFLNEAVEVLGKVLKEEHLMLAVRRCKDCYALVMALAISHASKVSDAHYDVLRSKVWPDEHEIMKQL